MIYVIVPLVQGVRRSLTRILVYVGAAIGAATLLLLALAAVGMSHRTNGFVLAGVSVLLLGYGARHMGFLEVPLITSRWQVPSSWAAWHPFLGSTLYGASMGLGFPTRAPFATFHGVLLWSFFAASAPAAAVAGVAFGLGRSLALLVPRFAQRSEGSFVARAQTLYQKPALLHVANGMLLAALGCGLLLLGVRS